MKRPILSLLAACFSFAAHTQQFSLIKDINPGSGTSNICYLTKADEMLFFAANDGTHGMELWKSDGSTGGTTLVKDINVGSASSSIGYLTYVNHIVFFVANDGVHGNELWKSDGTAAGTVMVKDIKAGSMSSNPSGLVNVNGTLFFAAESSGTGTELWKSDGTAAGTVLVKDIRAVGSSYPQSLAAVNGILFFAADNGTTGTELWKSDGTAAGTVLVKDIWPGNADSYPYSMTGVGSTVYFAANDGVNGTELWKSDGTAEGTVMVKDVWPGEGESYPYNLINVAGTLYFTADNGVHGTEVWKSDGTTNGTMLVKDIWPGPESGAVGNFSRVVSLLIFTANDGNSGYRTWQSDGTVGGTMIANVADPGTGNMEELVETNTRLYASIQESEMGRELWGSSFSIVLPVKFIEFNGRLSNEDALLDWITEGEVNVNDYSVERSTDNRTYVDIGRVAAKNVSGNHSYRFNDRGVKNLNTTVIYYRIRQNDRLGRHLYSRIIALSVDAKEGLSLFPNPTLGDMTITLNAGTRETVNWQVYDNRGRLLVQEQRQVNTGSNSFTIPTAGLANGVYYMRLTGNQLAHTTRFVKQ